MPRPTGPTNPILKQVISELKVAGHKNDVPFMVEIARLLNKGERQKVEVNISKIERYANKNDIIVVPGKVLASGEITKPVTISAAAFSDEAAKKIEAAGGKGIPLVEMIEKHPKGTDVRILC